ncbi:hypothetical protein LKM01_18030 [Bacillus pacificus]|uniref:hypothetical protein n=1 Tax=Bacillus pacificus TaxID=2026187 RepID=UPI001E368AF1|nr:hypothetical protein [Bacillus pacificus]MCC2483726.1 hypothetical protein [Bacillus pacificus]
MNEYKNPIPSILQLLQSYQVPCYGNKFPSDAEYPAVVIRTAGGNGYSRLQLISRSEKSDIEAMEIITNAMNILENKAAKMKNLQVLWCRRDSNPVSYFDQESNKEESWCYMSLEHLEA